MFKFKSLYILIKTLIENNKNHTFDSFKIYIDYLRLGNLHKNLK